jgi:hypothetical protein
MYVIFKDTTNTYIYKSKLKYIPNIYFSHIEGYKGYWRREMRYRGDNLLE